MANESRVLFEGPAPTSGADALFQLLQQDQAAERQQKQATFESGIRQKETEQKHGFAKELASLNYLYRSQELEKAKALDQTFDMQKMQQRADFAGQAAASAAETIGPIPGLPMMESPETSMATGQPSYAAPAIPPAAAEDAISLISRGAEDFYKRRQQYQTDARKDLLERMNRVTADHVSTARSAAKTLREYDETSPWIGVLESFREGDKTEDLHRAMSEAAKSEAAGRVKLQTVDMINSNRRYIAELNAANDVEVEKLKQMQKLDGAARLRLNDIRATTNASIQALEDSRRDLTTQLASGMVGGKTAQAMQAQRGQIEADLLRLRKRLEDIAGLEARALSMNIQGPNVDVQKQMVVSQLITEWYTAKKIRSTNVEELKTKYPDQYRQLTEEVAKRLRDAGY